MKGKKLVVVLFFVLTPSFWGAISILKGYLDIGGKASIFNSRYFYIKKFYYQNIKKISYNKIWIWLTYIRYHFILRELLP